MANDNFNPKQLATLEELFRRVLDERLEARFLEERAYFIQYFRQEFAELRKMIERIDRRTDEDARASAADISAIKKRVTKLEANFAKFQTAHAH